MASARAQALGALVLVSVLASAASGAGLLTVADGFLTSPAGLTGQDGGAGTGAWVAAGQARLWGMDDLPVTALSAGLTRAAGSGHVGLSASWCRIGSVAVRQDRVTGRLGREGRWSLALQAVGRRVSIAPEPGSWAVDWCVEVGRRVGLTPDAALDIRLAAVAVSAPGSDEPEPLGELAWTAPGSAGTLELHRGREGSPELGLDAWLLGPRGLSVGLRWDGASGSLGPTVAARRGPLLLRTAHTVHPVLGVTHRCELVWGALGAARR